MIAAMGAVLVILLALGAPIGCAILAACLIPNYIDPSFIADGRFAFRTIISSLDSYVLLAIPLFTISGILMAKGGISRRLFTFFSYFFGDVTAGIPCAIIITCLFYGAISGSGPATVAAVGAMVIPMAVELGYDRAFITSLVATSAGLGVIIPPSIPYVVYGMTANVSIANLFIAGILPGCLIALFLMICAYIICRKKGEDKEKLRIHAKSLREKGFVNVLKESSLALLCPVIILGGIYSGFFTPTEAACISVVYALIVSRFVYKTMNFRDIVKTLINTADSLVGMLFVVGVAVYLARVMAMLQIPQLVTSFITTSISSRITLLLTVNLFLLVVGMFIDALSAILICTPLLLPIMNLNGYDPVQLGIVMTVNLAIGFVTPPVGANLFVAANLTGIPVISIAQKAIPFLGFFFIALMFITFIPAISLLLLW